MRISIISLVFAAVHAAAAASGQEPAAKPLLTLTADNGYYEEAFALDGAGGRLAVIHADSAGAHELQLIDIDQKGAILARQPLPATPPVALFQLPSGTLVVTRADESGPAEAVFLGADKPPRSFAQATDYAAWEAGGRWILGALDKRAASWEVSLFDLGSGKSIVHRSLVVDAAGNIPALEMTPLYFRAGYGQLVGRHQGGYDKKKDRRMNDSQATYDVIKGVIVRDEAPADLIAWTRLVRERTRRQNQDTFVYVSEDQRHIFAVTSDDKVAEINLPLASYDVASLAQQADADGRLTFSLTVDPLNPEAVGRKKRDPELIHFYRFDPRSATPSKPERLLEVPRGGRDFLWRAAATRIAILRKHKSFGRGGPEIEVYDLVR